MLLAVLKGSFSDLWGRQHLKNLAPSFENPCSESAQMNKDGEMWPRVLSAFIYLVYRSAIGLHWKDRVSRFFSWIIVGFVGVLCVVFGVDRWVILEIV